MGSGSSVRECKVCSLLAGEPCCHQASLHPPAVQETGAGSDGLINRTGEYQLWNDFPGEMHVASGGPAVTRSDIKGGLVR